MHKLGDYTNDELINALAVCEQIMRYEKSDPYYAEMTTALHVLRAVTKIGRGTQWLSELSATAK